MKHANAYHVLYTTNDVPMHFFNSVDKNEKVFSRIPVCARHIPLIRHVIKRKI